MPTISQRIASAFAVLRGQYGDVIAMANDREQSRQSLYREAELVANAVDGVAAQARIDDLQHQLALQEAEVQALQERLTHAVQITPLLGVPQADSGGIAGKTVRTGRYGVR